MPVSTAGTYEGRPFRKKKLSQFLPQARARTAGALRKKQEDKDEEIEEVKPVVKSETDVQEDSVETSPGRSRRAQRGTADPIH